MTDLVNYQNKRVVVSGCFSGMGEATAKLLLKLGAEVHGLDYKDSSLPLASFTRVDLRDPSVDRCCRPEDRRPGRCALQLRRTAADLPAGRGHEGQLRRYPVSDRAHGAVDAEWRRHRLRRIDRRLRLEPQGARHHAAAEERHVSRAPSNGARPTWRRCGEGYSFSKEVMIVWTMMTAAHLIKRGIRLNCTLPGPTQTPMMSEFESKTAASVIAAATQPINRRSTPEEQAGPLVFLNSDAASYVNGVALPGGRRLHRRRHRPVRSISAP